MAPMPEAETIDIPALLRSYLNGETDLICIVGPTASGKTRTAVRLCMEIDRLLAEMPDRDKDAAGAEILSADSRQVYRGMDIGTGKDLEEYGTVPYHLIDIAEAGDRYSIFDYQRDFSKAYGDVLRRGGIPVLCGGSGLYIEAATCGYSLPQVPPDMKLREMLEKESTETLHRKLLSLNPDAAESTLASRRRTIRAIEVATHGKGRPGEQTLILPGKPYFIGTLVSREERNARIDRRLDERLRDGMAEEVKGLLAKGISKEDLIYYGLEYKYVTQYVTGVLDYGDMHTLLSNAIHQFAKRQMTWFRGMERDGRTIRWTHPF